MLRSRRTRWILGTLAILGVLLIGALCFLLIDEAPPEVDDLLGYREELPDAENGLVQLGLEKGEVFWPGRSGLDLDLHGDLPGEPIPEESVEGPSETFDPEAAARVVARNEEVLRRLEEATELPFRFPDSSFLDYDTVQPVFELSYLAKALGCRARLRLERSEREGALADIFLLLELGEHVEGGQGGILPYLFGLAMQDRALEHVARFLIGETDRQPLSAISRRLQSIDVEPENLADAFRAEFAASVRVVDAIRKGETPAFQELPPREEWGVIGRFLLLPDQTKRILAEICRQNLRNIERPPGEREALDIAEEYGMSGLWALRNSLGKTIVAITAIGGESILGQRDRFLAQLAATRALVALRAYQLEHGELPERLEELVPAYLEELPRDPFDGRSLRYSPEKKILYSVGEDLEDAGGSFEEKPSKARRDRNEPAFRIPF